MCISTNSHSTLAQHSVFLQLLETYEVSVANVLPYPEFCKECIVWEIHILTIIFLSPTSLKKLPAGTSMYLWSSQWTSGANRIPCTAFFRVCETLSQLSFLTDKERLVSESTRSDSRGLDTNWNSFCVYNVGRKARSSDCIDTVLSVFKFIINIGCL